MTNANAAAIAATATAYAPTSIVGAPMRIVRVTELDTDHFVISFKAPSPTTGSRVGVMTRYLDRDHYVVHYLKFNSGGGYTQLGRQSGLDGGAFSTEFGIVPFNDSLIEIEVRSNTYTYIVDGNEQHTETLSQEGAWPYVIGLWADGADTVALDEFYLGPLGTHYADLTFTPTPSAEPTMGDYALWVRDPSLAPKGRVDTYIELAAKLICNDVGSWTLALDRSHPALADLTTPGYGIVLQHRDLDKPVMSGMVNGWLRVRDNNDDEVVIHGLTDDAWLAWRVAHPDPSRSTAPYAEVYARSGNAGLVIQGLVNVNAGPGAIGRRVVPNLSIGEVAYDFDTTSIEGRWQPVMDIVKAVADDVGAVARILWTSETFIEFTFVHPADRTMSVRFSVEQGTIESYQYGVDGPVADYVYLGGPGEGAARTIIEAGNTASRDSWGYSGYREAFVDAQSSKDSSSLSAQLSRELKARLQSTEVAVKPTNTELRFPRDWNLGDLVTVTIEGTDFTEQVRVIDLKIGKDGVEVTPDVTGSEQGHTLDDHNAFVLRQIKRLQQRVIEAERK